VFNSVLWPRILSGPGWCMTVTEFGIRLRLRLRLRIRISFIPNSVTNTHQPGLDNTCGHNTELTTTMYFN
jgi:hypothetical protein